MATYTKIVDPNNGAGTDYTSLLNWEAGEQALYTSGDIAIADCRRTGATKDTTAVAIAGWTSGVIPKIIVNAAYRHEGKWADQRSGGNRVYILELNTAGNHGIWVQHAGTTHIDGLQITGSTGQTAVQQEATGSTLNLSNNIIRNHTPASARAVVRASQGGVLAAWNNIIYGATAAGQDGIECAMSANLYNNLVYGCGGYGILRTAGVVAPKNNVCMANTSGQFSGAFTGSGNNVSSDASAPGTPAATNQTSYADYFVDPANGDFHLKASSQSLWGIASANLFANFTKDIDEQDRPNSDQFGIGPDLYVASGGSPIPVFLASYRRRRY